VRIAGLVLVRQRPGTASGIVFVTLEDETGVGNLVVWSSVFDRFRASLMTAGLLGCAGKVQREGDIIHVVAETLLSLDEMLAGVNKDGVDVDIAPAGGFGPAGAAEDDMRLHSRDFH
jgi:error-prone DNA polymerase